LHGQLSGLISGLIFGLLSGQLLLDLGSDGRLLDRGESEERASQEAHRRQGRDLREPTPA